VTKTYINQFRNNLHEQIIKVCHSLKLELHFNHRGPKQFDNYQRVALIILYIRSKKSLRDFLEEFEENKWKNWLQFRHIPAKSTLHDWLKLFELKIIRELNKQLTKDILPVLTAIDGTGLDSNLSSKHYEKRLKDFGFFKPKNSYAKLDIWIDIKTLVILDFVLVMQPHHDVIAAEKIFKRNTLKNIEILADRGYDSEPLHKLIRENGGVLFAPVRNKNKKTKGFFRKKCRILPEYMGKRSLVETVNSILKRVQITALRAKKAFMKKRELAWHVILYNMKRLKNV
jgi:hypothetical protein